MASTKIIFGQFALRKWTFADLLRNEKSWCWNFILNYSNDANHYLYNDNDNNEYKNINKEIKKNCCALYEYLCNESICHKKTLLKYQKNCKKWGITDNIPTLIGDKNKKKAKSNNMIFSYLKGNENEHGLAIEYEEEQGPYWLFANNPYSKLGGKSGSAGKWMLFCNKQFLTYSYNRSQTELSLLFHSINSNHDNNDNNDDNEEKKDFKNNDKINKKDMMLTELDYYWLKVSELVTTNNLGFAAKVSTNMNRQKMEDADGVIIVYTHNSDDMKHVLQIAHNIRKLVGFVKEEIRYKTDEATIKGQYGDKSHLYKHTISKYNELQIT